MKTSYILKNQQLIKHHALKMEGVYLIILDNSIIFI